MGQKEKKISYMSFSFSHSTWVYHERKRDDILIRSTWKSHTHNQNGYPNLISLYFAGTFIKRGSTQGESRIENSREGWAAKRKTNFLRRSDVFESNKAISRVNCNTYLRKPKSFHKSVKTNFLTNLFQYDAHGTFWNRC